MSAKTESRVNFGQFFFSRQDFMTHLCLVRLVDVWMDTYNSLRLLAVRRQYTRTREKRLSDHFWTQKERRKPKSVWSWLCIQIYLSDWTESIIMDHGGVQQVLRCSAVHFAWAAKSVRIENQWMQQSQNQSDFGFVAFFNQNGYISRNKFFIAKLCSQKLLKCLAVPQTQKWSDPSIGWFYIFFLIKVPIWTTPNGI